MVEKKLKICIAGEGSGGVRLAQSLLKMNHKIVGVLSSPDDYSFTSMWNFADREGIPKFDLKEVNNKKISTFLETEEVEVLLSIRSPHIFPTDILRVPTIGSYNLHTGPLPEYAGLNVISWALYNGEEEFGVTFHKMDSSIDGGPIIYKESFMMNESDSALSVTQKCIKLGLILILRFVYNIANDVPVVMIDQDRSMRNYYGRDLPSDGFIDWTDSAKNIFNYVRACDFHPFPSPWGVPKTVYNGDEVGVLKASLGENICYEKPGLVRIRHGDVVEVATGTGWLNLELLSIRGEPVDPKTVIFDNDCFDSFGKTS